MFECEWNAMSAMNVLTECPIVCSHGTVERFGAVFEDDSFLQSVFGKLEGFCFYETDVMKALFYDKLLSRTSHKVLSLHVDAPIAAPPNGLGNLREICIYNANHSKISCITQSATTLERVHFEFIANKIESGGPDAASKLEDELVSLFTVQSLESLSLKMDRDIDVVKRALRRTMESGKFVRRQSMRMKLYIKEEIENAIEYLEILTNLLKDSSEDYILKFRCVLTQNMVGRVTTFDCVVGDVLRLTRTNAGCKLNGYQERWLYPCICNK